jgi:hypothetical protein
MRVTIVHLDLGIGGAEQLIVNIATVLKELGHEVQLLTSHHDKNHCFEETKPDGKAIHNEKNIIRNLILLHAQAILDPACACTATGFLASCSEDSPPSPRSCACSIWH